jgi:DNA polymerase-3 subunit gamma/tau
MALIARSATGSFRDALGTLDQLVAFGGDSVTTDEVVEVLGAADAELLFGTTDALASGDARGALEVVERLSRSGRDPGQFARDLIAHLRQLLVARATGEVPESFTVTVAQPERLAEQAGGIDDARLMGAIDALSGAVAGMREGDDPRLTLEVALLKVTSPSLDSSREALLRRIEQLEARLGGDGGPPAENPKHAEAPATEEKPPEEEADQSVATATVEVERIVELWPAVVGHLRESGSAMLSTLFDEARPLGIDEERAVVRVGFPASAKFNKKKAESAANVDRMAEAIAAIAGHRLRPAYELIDDGSEASEPEESAAVDEEELIDMIKDNFDASEVVSDDARESEAG